MKKLTYQFNEQEDIPVKTGLNEHKFYFYAVYNTKNGNVGKEIITMTAGDGIGFQFLPGDRIAFIMKANTGYDLPVRFRLNPNLIYLKELFMEKEVYDGLKATTNRRPTQASGGTSKTTSTNKSE